MGSASINLVPTFRIEGKVDYGSHPHDTFETRQLLQFLQAPLKHSCGVLWCIHVSLQNQLNFTICLECLVHDNQKLP